MLILPMKIDKIILNIWNKFPKLRNIIRNFLSVSANIIIGIGRFVGNVYTTLFGVLGTSWYDHRYDVLRGVENFHWMERAFFTLDKLRVDDSILDIGCGDGLFDGVFYSDVAKEIVAIDKDKKAIKHANNLYKKKNISFQKKDITKWKIPHKSFDVITLYAVIEHFAPKVGVSVLKNIKNGLKDKGKFIGSTPIFNSDKTNISNWEHENEFTSVNDLNNFLSKVFTKVKLKKSIWSNKRTDCYFECSN